MGGGGETVARLLRSSHRWPIKPRQTIDGRESDIAAGARPNAAQAPSSSRKTSTFWWTIEGTKENG